MSEEEIREGDRFEWLPEGRTVEVQCENGTVDGTRRMWLCRYLDGDHNRGVGVNCVLEDPQYWRRLPREAPTIEERRAALDTFENLAPFMEPQSLADLRAKVVRNYEADRASTAEWEAKRAKPPAGKPDPTPTGLKHIKRVDDLGGRTFCGALRDERSVWSPANANCPVCLAAIEAPPEPQPSPPPRGLPFKYVDDCAEAAKHDGVSMCRDCEGIIAYVTKTRDRYAAEQCPPNPPQRPEPHRPSDTGMGSVVGPVLSRLR